MQAKLEAKMTWLTALTVKWGPFFIEINSFYMKCFRRTVLPFLNVNHSLYFEQGRRTVIRFAVFFQCIIQSSACSRVRFQRNFAMFLHCKPEIQTGQFDIIHNRI